MKKTQGPSVNDLKIGSKNFDFNPPGGAVLPRSPYFRTERAFRKLSALPPDLDRHAVRFESIRFRGQCDFPRNARWTQNRETSPLKRFLDAPIMR